MEDASEAEPARPAAGIGRRLRVYQRTASRRCDETIASLEKQTYAAKEIVIIVDHNPGLQTEARASWHARASAFHTIAAGRVSPMRATAESPWRRARSSRSSTMTRRLRAAGWKSWWRVIATRTFSPAGERYPTGLGRRTTARLDARGVSLDHRLHISRHADERRDQEHDRLQHVVPSVSLCGGGWIRHLGRTTRAPSCSAVRRRRSASARSLAGRRNESSIHRTRSCITTSLASPDDPLFRAALLWRRGLESGRPQALGRRRDELRNELSIDVLCPGMPT